ncbi:LOB domain-containing protein 6-like [Phoenix dactylifera]|uniref:LOB domain-containing protein 6-like n=1 Tax=Phoenix dactylifera TaxID=42345 RepID=A0A8B9ASV7_PHODC|nr:LOB domain-containing protein 6-like [Phoenix dactylifera]
MSDNNVQGSPVSSVTSTDSPPRQAACAPCAACKRSRRRCPPGCVFAPVFPQNQYQKFMNVHRVYGTSNVGKLLAELQPHQRAAAADSLAYEAEMRLRNPAFGSLGIITLLRQHLRGLQLQLEAAKAELSRYQSMSNRGLRYGVVRGGGGGGGRQGLAQGVIKDDAHEDRERKPMVMGHNGQSVMAAMQQGTDMNASAMRNKPYSGQFAGSSGAWGDGNHGTNRLLGS